MSTQETAKASADALVNIPEAPASNNGHKKILSFGVISFSLSFEGFPTFGFEFTRKLVEEIKLLRQEFYGLTKAEQKEKTTAYRLEFLSKSLKSRPTGLDALDYPDTGDMVADFQEFFGRDDNSELLEFVWTMHQDMFYPKELLSTPSE